MLLSFRAAVEDCNEVCSSLGAWKARHLTGDFNEAALVEHQRWVTELLVWGRRVLRATQEPAFPDEALAARVAARVRHLEDKPALWHRPMEPADEDRILNLAFP